MAYLIRKNKKLFLYILVLCIAVFLPYILLNHGIILMRGDPYELNFKLWQGGWEAVHAGTLKQYCWSLGLGSNTFSYVFYFLTNPFFWISCLFPKSFLPYSFLVFLILEMWLGFVAAYVWLYKITRRESGALIGAFIVAFCSYNFFYSQAEQLLKLIFLYPLALYFLECWLQDAHWKGFVLTIGALGITNYYVLYQFIPFLCVYVILRWMLLKHQDRNHDKFWPAALKFAGMMILGIGISAIILIPCGELILSMPRFTNGAVAPGTHLDRWQIYRIFTSLLVPAFAKLDANPFISTTLVASYGWSGGASLYSLILTPVLLPLLGRLKDKHERRIYAVFLLILLIFMAFPYFYYLFQMSVDTRWFYMFPLYNAMLAAVIHGEVEDGAIARKYVYRSGIALLIVLAGCLAFSWIKELNTAEKLIYLSWTAAGMAVLILIYLHLYRKQAGRKAWILALSAEALLSGAVFYLANGPIDWWAFDDETISSDIGSYLRSTDSGFYRVQYDNKSVVLKKLKNGEDDTLAMMTGNEPFANGYSGFGFYESVYNTNQEEFLWRLKSSWNMTQLVGRIRTYNMLSSKYWYTFDNSDPVPYGYEKIYTSPTGYDLYENRNYVELGYTYDKTVSKAYVLDQSYLDQDRIMSEYLVTEDSTNTAVELNDKIQYLATLPATDVRTYTFASPVSNVNLYIETYGLPEAKILLYYQGSEVASYDFWQFNYVDFPVYQKIDQIVIEAKAVYSKQTELKLYTEPLDGSYDTAWAEQTAEHFTNVVFQGDRIEGDIQVSGSGKYVFTSIPYDKGWDVMVDGRSISYEKVQMGFIGFQVESGSHHVTFVYHLPGLAAGAGVSALSISLVLLACLLQRHKKRRSSGEQFS